MDRIVTQEILDAALARGVRLDPVDEWAVAWAAEAGHADVVALLLDRRAPVDEWAVEWAARCGHAEIAEMLRRHVVGRDD